MFTGLVEDVGRIVKIERRGEGRRLVIATALPLHEVRVGDSIACDGACLTVESLAQASFEVTAGRETLARTTLGQAKVGDKLHLERAMRVGDRLDGHIVQGHVDGVGRIQSLTVLSESTVLWVEIPAALSALVAEKGSLCIDGVSLTVNEIKGHAARINLIPHTVEKTKLGHTRVASPVNLEVDVLARYVARQLAAQGVSDTSRWRDLLSSPTSTHTPHHGSTP